jgi:hypothetical protein
MYGVQIVSYDVFRSLMSDEAVNSLREGIRSLSIVFASAGCLERLSEGRTRTTPRIVGLTEKAMKSGF